MTLVKQCLGLAKETAGETADDAGLSDAQWSKLIGALNEVEFIVDVDTGNIVTVNGKLLNTAQDYEGPAC